MKDNHLGTHEMKIMEKTYFMRVLTVKQCYFILFDSFYEKETNNILLTKVLNNLIEQKYIELEYYGPDKVYILLTKSGFNYFVTSFDFEMYHEVNHIVYDNYITYNDYKMNKKLINHQLHLNNFVLKTESTLTSMEGVENYLYQDEKVALKNLKTVDTRPDGVLQVVYNGRIHIFLLEQDMNTETISQLKVKFERYQEMLRILSSNNKITYSVMFITDTFSRNNVVENVILDTLKENLKNNFNFYVKEENLSVQTVVDILKGSTTGIDTRDFFNNFENLFIGQDINSTLNPFYFSDYISINGQNLFIVDCTRELPLNTVGYLDLISERQGQQDSVIMIIEKSQSDEILKKIDYEYLKDARGMFLSDYENGNFEMFSIADYIKEEVDVEWI